MLFVLKKSRGEIPLPAPNKKDRIQAYLFCFLNNMRDSNRITRTPKVYFVHFGEPLGVKKSLYDSLRSLRRNASPVRA